VDRTLFDLRKKELLDLAAADVTALELRSPHQRDRPLALERRSVDGTTGWEIVRPVRAPADREAVAELIEKLSALRATKIIDEGKAERLSGLKQPRTEIVLQARERTARLRFYFPLGEEAAYAVTTPTAPLYQVDRQTVLQLDKSLFDLREKRIAAISPTVVQQIVVTGPGGDYRLDRRGTGWFFNDQELTSPGQQAVTSFLTELTQARVEKVAGQSPAAWPGFGLDRGVTIVTLTGGEGDPPVTVRIGKQEGDLVYVRRGDEPESYITKAALTTAIPASSKFLDLLNSSGQVPTADSKE
jgi:hypothetical protein